LRDFLGNGFSGGDFFLGPGVRSPGEAGARWGSSANLSGCGFLVPVNARPEGGAAAGLRAFPAKGAFGVDSLLGPGARALGVAEVRKVSPAACFGRDLLLPANSCSAAAAGWRLFLLEGFSGEALRLPCEGRRFFTAVVGPPAGVRVGFFLLTDKGSPRKKKEKSQLSSLEPERM